MVGVTWWEASTYAAWLTARLRNVGEIGEQEVVRLATTAEWQRAAGGPEERKYPWEGEFDPRRANSKESNLQQPTPVHMYPAGATPEGVLDLTGNVWEVCADGSSAKRWNYCAGGSWHSASENDGLAAQSWRDRREESGDLGFRVVIVRVSRA